MTRYYRAAFLGLAMMPMMLAAQSATPMKSASKDARPKTPVQHKQTKNMKTEQEAATAGDKLTQDPLAQRHSPEPPAPAGSGITATTPATNKTAK